MLRVGLLGYSGRMGQQIADILSAGPDVTLSAAQLRNASTQIAAQHGGDAVATAADAAAIFAQSDVVIDFTLPAATTAHVQLAAATGKALMCGTTGWDQTTQSLAREASSHAAIMLAPNTSLSLALTAHLSRIAAGLLRGYDYDIAITDEHHRMKKDAPSGTAKFLAEQVAAGNGKPQPPISSVRAGHIVGEHAVIFAGEGEVIRLHHSVTDRRIFARGAVQAAQWLSRQKPGLYTLNEMLGIGG
ncbi:MAG: 4-hydroxy-tetrahydrodipicolinate reductase [Alphaproteobacteria bacterium]|nr:4-hydroxy-tetrahydrodipicolinate reductase [Alphaproteobacteria bacterium]MBV8548393.1 4-hydroxy-tetrahydrodipicolinate reductase [Alphaproteobacteria bacterium]